MFVNYCEENVWELALQFVECCVLLTVEKGQQRLFVSCRQRVVGAGHVTAGAQRLFRYTDAAWACRRWRQRRHQEALPVTMLRCEAETCSINQAVFIQET